MKILTVLRAGGDFRTEHVERLRRQCTKWAPGVEFQCLWDGDGTLKHGWPGWWSKMCMFEDVREPFLYMDLDTTVAGPIDNLLQRSELTVLSDFNRPKQIQSSLMLVTPAAAKSAWSAWLTGPVRHIQECVTPDRWGDQGFLEGVWGRDIERWQNVLPGAIVSYKKHCLRGTPKSASVVVFHGKPRPWEVGL